MKQTSIIKGIVSAILADIFCFFKLKVTVILSQKQKWDKNNIITKKSCEQS